MDPTGSRPDTVLVKLQWIEWSGWGQSKTTMLKLIMKLGWKINILGSKIILWVNHLKTQRIFVQTRPKKRLSLCHWHDQQNYHSKMGKRTYQGNWIQTHHCQAHYQTNLICRRIEITINQLKMKAIRRKRFIKTIKRTRQTHCQAILVFLTTVTTDTSDVERRATRKRIR